MSPLQRSIESLEKLISFPSVSSTSNQQVSNWVSERLQSLGFKVEQTTYRDENDLEKVNVVGRRDPTNGRSDAIAKSSEQPFGLAYFCHTDVVPAVGWTGPGGDPFQAHQSNERLYGRGSCDMKGSLAAMLVAAEQVTPAEQTAPLWIVCTADEEVGFVGAKHLVGNSEAYRELVSAQPIGIIGEPTRLGVVHAHKGIIGMRITSRGRAAHSSSTDGLNANRRMVPLLQTLLEINEETQQSRQYMDDRFDPPTLSWNFGVSDDCKAINITPDRSVAWVSLRPMPQIDGGELIRRVEERARDLDLEFEIFEGGSPLWIEPDAQCIRDFCDLTGGAAKTVCYGTDGGEFDELNHRVVFGPGDIAQAHTTDEWIELEQLQQGIDLFANATRRWCVQQGH